MSKVLIINGSPRLNGNTAIAVREMEKVFHENAVPVLAGCDRHIADCEEFV